MNRFTRCVALSAVLVAVVVFVAFTAPAAFAGNPPDATERIYGRPIEGVFVAFPGVADLFGVPDATLIGIFVGNCKKVPVTFTVYEPTYGNPLVFNTLTSDDLMDYRDLPPAPAGCFSKVGGEDMIVTDVQRFDLWPGGTDPVTGEVITDPALGAVIEIMAVEPVIPK